MNETLLCVDGSKSAEEAIRQAGEVLGGGPAVVLCVWEPVATSMRVNPLDAYLSALGPPAQELDGIAEQIAGEWAARGVESARGAGFEPRPMVRRGEDGVWPEILEAADELDARVVVLGRRGLSRVQSLLLGSVSNGVLHHARRPVLVIPSPEEPGGATLGADEEEGG